MEKKLSSKYIHMYMSISRVFIRLTVSDSSEPY